MTDKPDSSIQYRSNGALAHLLTLEGMPRGLMEALLDRAQALAEGAPAQSNKQGILANVFAEPSTRTRVSFEVAAGRLGWQAIGLDAAGASTRKGETLADTVRNLAAMGITVVCIRHREPRAAWEAAQAAPGATRIVNAGGGSADHPTQGLLDALTIRQQKSDFSPLAIAICGDVKHSRVARSGVHAFTALGARDIRLVGPKALLPERAPDHCRLINDLESGIEDADVVIMLRIQKERMEAQDAVANTAEYYQQWGLTEERLKLARPDCMVLHPGPINRDVEISGAVADGPRSWILKQVTNGVFVRMAVLEMLQ